MILGIYLTQKVWIQFPEIIPGFFKEDEAIDEKNLLEDIIVPEKYLINFGQGEFTLIYDDREYSVFEEAKAIIKHMFSSKEITTSQISDEEYHEFKENKFIEFKYSEPMNAHILSASLDITNLNNIVDEIDKIHKIYFSLEEEAFFILTSGESHVLIGVEHSSLAPLKSQVYRMKNQENYVKYEPLEGVSSNTYIPKTTKIHLPELIVSNHILSLDAQSRNQLVERFFSREIDYIREIVESNGSTIYEYDNSVLKLNSNGVMEYFHVLEDSYSEPNLYISLSTAVDFLTNRVGVSNDIFLSRVEEIQSNSGNGYRLYFRYQTNNIPLIVGDGFGDYIQVDVFNNQIKTYRQLDNEGYVVNRKNDLVRNILSPREIIDNNAQLEQHTIESIDLSYFDSGTLRFNQRLQLVWAIETSDKLYVFDAYIGSLIYER